MSMGAAFLQRLARRLLEHACAAAPAARKEWAEAMVYELEQVPRGMQRLQWALGCVLAIYQERVRHMKGSILHLPRWLLALEMLVCFVPLTWLFLAVLVMTSRGAMPPAWGIVCGSAAVIGPLGLLVTVRTSLARTRGLRRPAGIVLDLLAAWTLIAYTGLILHDGNPIASWWRDYVLIAVLPAVAVAHLVRINAERQALAGA